MPRPFSRNQIDKLGDRLAPPVPISANDRAMIEELLRAYDEALNEASHVIATGTGMIPTGRLKTLHTMREKVRRGTELSTMQDIAGLRLVLGLESGRSSQNAVVQTIESLYPGCRRVDRRLAPMHGYRAVHLIIRVDGCPVEVQVRTHLQDLWAQVVERLADLWGRQIRYGEIPDETCELVAGLSRRQVVETIMSAADTIDAYEVAADNLERSEGQLVDVDIDDLDDEARRVFEEFNSERDEQAARTAAMSRSLQELRRVLAERVESR
jgi:ppGpp synthetase/RelA/SpoT-type nucleotidyltranferase